MSTMATLLNHQVTPGSALAHTTASPMATPTSGASGTNGADSSSTNSATVSANDFLTLLVTEMQNQDPTSDTDPNEYINQLVNVNSLEQLIDINQTLSTDLTAPSSSSSTGGTSGTSPDATSATSGSGNAVAPASARSLHAASLAAAQPTASTPQASTVSGNLSASQANPAAARVGHALTQRSRAVTAGGIPLADQ